MELRKESTIWPIADYVIIPIGHGYGLFQNNRTILCTSYDIQEVNHKLDRILKGN